MYAYINRWIENTFYTWRTNSRDTEIKRGPNIGLHSSLPNREHILYIENTFYILSQRSADTLLTTSLSSSAHHLPLSLLPSFPISFFPSPPQFLTPSHPFPLTPSLSPPPSNPLTSTPPRATPPPRAPYGLGGGSLHRGTARNDRLCAPRHADS